jgi:CHAD domain-containing protein
MSFLGSMPSGPYQERDLEQVRQVVTKRLKKAGEALRSGPALDSCEDDAAHIARKRIKEVRALLRLTRNGFPAKKFRHDNQVLRNAARPLSEIRDATAVVDAFRAILKQDAALLDHPATATLMDALQRRLARVINRKSTRKAFAESAAAVDRVRRHNKRWHVDGEPDKLLASGLKGAYKKANRARMKAQDKPSDTNLHEWRKRVKDLRYQLELLEPLWPVAMRVPARQAKILSDILGDDHDLILLRDLLNSELRGFIEEEAIQVLSLSINRRRSELQRSAWSLGDQLFVLSPGEFARCLGIRHAAA